MAFINDFMDMFPDTVIWKPLVSRDSYGKPTFHATGYEYMARVVKHPKMVRNKDGQMVTSSAQAHVGIGTTSGMPFPVISPQDQVVLSDGKTPPIIGVDIIPDENGPAYSIVNFV
jgi:hypothetical protein